MKSPLIADKENVKKFNIPKSVELHPRQKLAFLEEQLHQLKSMHWRSRVDILHATRMSESDNEVLKSKGLQNLGNHINEVQQTIGGIEMITKLIEELRKESPDLGEVSAQDHPEN